MKTFLKKKIFFLTFSLFISLNSLLFQSNTNGLFAQPDIFLTSSWNIIDGEINGELVQNSSYVFYRLDETESFLIRYGISCTEFITVLFDNVTNDSFSLGSITEFIPCDYTDPDEIALVNLQNSLFFEIPIDENGTPKNPFTYAYIENSNNDVDLLITNANGDWALFQRPFLSTNTFHQNSFTVYPNPAKETLFVKNSFQQEVNATVYNLNGKLVQSYQLNAGQSQINVKQLKAGLYFVVFESETGERVSKKFVKSSP